MKYFIVHTTDNRTFDMGRKCNHIEYGGDRFCIFYQCDEKTKIDTPLMFIPYSLIARIENVEDGEIGE